MSKKLIKCKVCGEEIAKDAKTCPKCGTKVKKGKGFLIGAIILCLIVIIAVSSNNDEPKKVSNNSQTTKQTDSDSKAEEKESDNDKNVFSVGEAAEMNNIIVSLKDVSESSGSDFNKPSDGNVFLICEFEITNNSDEEINVSSMLSFEAYCDDYTCSFSLSALLEKENKNQLDGTVAAGKKFNGVVGYEVPSDWKNMEIHFTPDFWGNKDFVFVAEKQQIFRENPPLNYKHAFLVLRIFLIRFFFSTIKNARKYYRICEHFCAVAVEKSSKKQECNIFTESVNPSYNYNRRIQN